MILNSQMIPSKTTKWLSYLQMVLSSSSHFKIQNGRCWPYSWLSNQWWIPLPGNASSVTPPPNQRPQQSPSDCQDRANSDYLSLSVFIYLSIYLYLSIYIFIHLYLYLFISLSIHIFIHLYLYLSISLSSHIFSHLYLYLSISLSIYIFIYPYLYLPISNYIFLYFHMSFCI